jgi:Zn-dependent protease
MLQTIRIGKLFGIDTYIHWSFWILLLWIALPTLLQGKMQESAIAILVIGIVFICVYLHELGHAKMAEQFGINTLDISILPIGGLARLEQLPKDAKAEFWIAIAGPLVNFALAALSFAIAVISYGSSSIDAEKILSIHFWEQLLVINLVLGVFNLIPAIPMDGGRILRSLLQNWMSRTQATRIAARVSRYIAMAMILFGIFYSFSLVLIGLFVLVGSFAESVSVQIDNLRNGMPPFPGDGFEFHGPGDRDNNDDKTLDATEVRHLP